MTNSERAVIFDDRYPRAGKGGKVTVRDLFSIEFADGLTGRNLKDMCLKSNVPISCANEMHKGIRLARHVSLNK